MGIKIIDDTDEIVTLSSSISSEIQVVDITAHLAQLSASNVSLISADTIEITTTSPGYYGLIWDAVGSRVYESGIDRGVLYLPDGTAIPWNGLTSVVESSDKEVTPIYYDGMKINDAVTLGDFSGTLKAITYPDEFLELEGFGSSEQGIIYGDQKPKAFGLSYRTQVGNDVAGDVAGYKIHIIYNVTATPSDKTYATIAETTAANEFEWSIIASPEEIPGFRPTAHIILDTRKVNPFLLAAVEELLYGSNISEPLLIPMADLITYLNSYYTVKITDNGDGTWTATAQRTGYIDYTSPDVFEILNVNASYVNPDEFVISDTI